MPYWLLKTEPSSYSYADLLRDGRTVWDGVRNAQALIHLRAMRGGDEALIYHSGDERRVMGTATIDGDPYVDPHGADNRLTVVDVRAVRLVPRPVPLSAIKTDLIFVGHPLVRQPRLSVMPLTPEQWQRLMVLAELDPNTD